MKINLEGYTLKLKEEFRIARGSTKEREHIFVKLFYRDTIGLGEAVPLPRYNEKYMDVWNFLANLELEDDPSKIKETVEQMDENMIGLNSAKAAVDMAMYDIEGILNNEAIHKRLGLSLTNAKNIMMTVGLNNEKAMIKKALEFKKYPIIKVKFDKKTDPGIISKMHEKTHARFIIDANEAWNVDEAIDKLKYFEKFDYVLFAEQPIQANQLDDLETLKSKTKVKIFLDEDIINLKDLALKKGLCDGINVKVLKVGGLYKAIRLITTARTYNLDVMLGCFPTESSVAITAAAHISPLVDFLDLDSVMFLENDPFIGAYYEKEKLYVPRRPGIGVIERKKMH